MGEKICMRTWSRVFAELVTDLLLWCIYGSIHASIHMYVRMYTCTFVHKHIRTYLHTYIHIIWEAAQSCGWSIGLMMARSQVQCPVVSVTTAVVSMSKELYSHYSCSPSCINWGPDKVFMDVHVAMPRHPQ